MSDLYSVKLNRSEGSVEISGPDKEWLESKLAGLLSVLDTPTSSSSSPSRDKSTGPKSADASAAAKPKQSASRRGGSVATDGQFAERFTNEVAERLEAYMGERPAAKAAQEQVAAITGFLFDELDIPDVGESELNTIYTKMGWPLPALSDALRNATERKQYFTRAARGRFQLTRTGLNYARHESKAGE